MILMQVNKHIEEMKKKLDNLSLIQCPTTLTTDSREYKIHTSQLNTFVWVKR